MSLLEPIQIRWADIDQNRHLRHSVYYDYAAMSRIQFLSQQGLTTNKLDEFKIGPILFREEAIFKKEIKFEDTLTIQIELLKASEDFSRWSLRHNFFKNDNVLTTILHVDGAWLDLEKRKLAMPNEFIQNIFKNFPRPVDFEWIPLKKPVL